MNMSTKQEPFLKETDPAPYTLRRGDSLVLFTGPHNGRAVPKCLCPSLDTCPEWFSRAHEAVDLNMSELFDVLYNEIPNASYIAGNYSRLVYDLNAKPDYAIRSRSCENENHVIPPNLPNNCTLDDRQRRMKAVYDPYHDAKSDLIKNIRAQHNGQILVLDMHSFTPTWRGQKRDVEIGTIRSEKTHLSRTLEDYLRGQSEYRFISGEPYRVADRPSNAAPDISEKNKLQYLGIEIRYDLIDNMDKRLKMADFIKESVEYLLSHPDKDKILAVRQPEQPKEITYDTWSV